MDKKLIEHPTNELLIKFGLGNHKPGSGSAAALQGMLAAQLILTVIDITTSEKYKEKYGDCFLELTQIDLHIKNNIYPRLEILIQEDSDQFNKAIKLRNLRDSEADFGKKHKLNIQSLEELKYSTEIPLEIANLCSDLCSYGDYVFNNGFKSARGDSTVALSSAMSAVFGCLSIIELNLLLITELKLYSEDSNDWISKISKGKTRLQNLHKEFIVKSNNNIEKQNKLIIKKNKFIQEINFFKTLASDNKYLSNSDIEELTLKLQNTIWTYRNRIWKKNKPKNDIEILNPEKILNLFDYNFIKQESLEHYNDKGSNFEVAGVINKEFKTVEISTQFSDEVQNFTAAHELGHALLHNKVFLHRDKPLDGSSFNDVKDFKETQANKFASYFLMPKNQIKEAFYKIFSLEKFVINDDSVFPLNQGSAYNFRNKFSNSLELAMFLSSVEFYNFTNFTSLSKQFNVSNKAMAIRLVELDLIALK